MTASEIIKKYIKTTVVYYTFIISTSFLLSFLLGFWAFDLMHSSFHLYIYRRKGGGGEEIGVRDCLSPTDMKIKRPKNEIKIERNII